MVPSPQAPSQSLNPPSGTTSISPDTSSTMSMMGPNTSLPPLDLSVTNEVGPWLVGSLLASLEFGALLVLVSMYFARYGRKDRTPFKVIVGALTVLSTTLWSVEFYLLWHFMISTRSLTDSLASQWDLVLSPKVSVFPLTIMPLSCALSQAFFAWRAYHLSGRKKWVVVALTVLIIASLAVGIALSVVVYMGNWVFFNGNDLENFTQVQGVKANYWLSVHLLEAFLAISAFTDVLVTFILIVYLLPSRRGFNPRTDTLISHILYLSFATGSISSISAFIDVFLALGTVHRGNHHVAMCLGQSHIYALVLVASLNLRKTIDPYEKGKNGTSEGVSVSRISALSGTMSGGELGSGKHWGGGSPWTSTGSHKGTRNGNGADAHGNFADSNLSSKTRFEDSHRDDHDPSSHNGLYVTLEKTVHTDIDAYTPNSMATNQRPKVLGYDA